MNLLKGKNYQSDDCIFDIHSFATELDEDTLRTKVNGGGCDASAPSASPSSPAGSNTPATPAITGTTPTTTPGTSTTTNTPNPSDASNPASGYMGGENEPSQDVMSNSQEYGYWKALQDLEIKKAILERLDYDLDLQKYVKENSKIVITRDPMDNGKNGNYYKSSVKLQVGDITFFEGKIQSTADGLDKDKGKTLPVGEYTGVLLNKSDSYINAISLQNEELGIQESGGFLIHPDAKTALGKYTSYSENAGRPYSLGCQISKLLDFGDMTNEIKKLGFEYGEYSDKTSWIKGDSIQVVIQ